MTDLDQKIAEASRRIGSLSQGEIDAHNARLVQKNEQDFQRLKESLSKGMCCYCDKPLTVFCKSQPCLHWLLAPKGFRKRHLPQLFEVKSFHEIQAYVRWLANCESPLRNINDLAEERSNSKVIEETIKFRNFEWSFSCSENDMKGHAGKYEGVRPHYHFQMKVDGLVVINFAGFHPEFHEYDHICFALKSGKIANAGFQELQGAGMQALFDNVPAETLLEQMNSIHLEDPKSAPFHLQTLVMAEPGTKISGEEIIKLQEESKKTGVPMAQLAKRLKNVRIQTIIEPGPGIPEISKRNPRS